MTETAPASPAASPRAPGPPVRIVGPAGYVALALGIAALLLVVAGSAWLSMRNREALEAASHERHVLRTVYDVATALDLAETGQRGFLLTGRDAYLEPFRQASEQVPAMLAALARDVADEPDARRLVAALQPVVADKMAELSETVAHARAGRRDAAMALVQTDRGLRDGEAIRRLTTELTRVQQALVSESFAAINARSRLLVLVDAAALLGLALLAGVIAAGISRYVRALRTAQQELHAANRALETANVDLEEIVRNRTADLVEANEEIQRFAYIVSHDLRAPLVNIMGFTSELETAAKVLDGFIAEARDRLGALPEEVAEAANDDIPEAIRFIKASTAKMDRLIGAILRLSREGRRVMTPERLDMRALLAGIVATVRHQAEARGAEIELGTAPPLVMDRLAAEQIFGNLIDNALKYLVPGRPGRIRVEGRMDGRVAEFTISDNGRGIAAKDRDRIFELFRRSGDQSVPGEGIGLAHVRALIRRLGGSIACDSILGEGTTFRVRLPAVQTLSRSMAA